MHDPPRFSALHPPRPLPALVALLLLFLVAAPGIGDDSPAPSDGADVRAFGAVGDGQADDTAAIQAAVDSGRGVVSFPKGIYRLTEPVVIELDRVGYTALRGEGAARIVMAGPGAAFRLIGTHHASAAPQTFDEAVWERQRMPLVDGLAITGDHPEACGIEATGTMQLTLTRLHIRGVLHAIRLYENNRNVIISDCHLYHNRGVGIFYDAVNLHQSNVSNCHISYNGQGGIVSRGGNVRNLHVTGCDLESNMSDEEEPTANVLIDCSDSSHGTGEVAITGCTIQHNSTSPDSANIRILGRSNPDRDGNPVLEGHVTITGNVLSDVRVNVHLRECRGVVLTGNTMWQGYDHDLLIEDCISVVVGPNNFDRNPRYSRAQDAADHGVMLRGCRDVTLQGLHLAGVWRKPAALQILDCQRVNVTGCTLLDNDHAGLLLQNVRLGRVSGCLIADERPDSDSQSLVVRGGEALQITGNLFRGAVEIDNPEAILESSQELVGE